MRAKIVQVFAWIFLYSMPNSRFVRIAQGFVSPGWCQCQQLAVLAGEVIVPCEIVGEDQ